MEFWGVEVKAGEAFKVELDKGRALHLSQACIGEVKKEKGQETVCLYVNVDGKKLVLGTLLSEKLPQQIFDLVFDKGFDLSHNWKNGSVFFYGYTADNLTDSESESSDSDEDISLVANGGPTAQANLEKPAEGQKTGEGKDNAAGKQKVKIVEPNKDDKSEDDDDSSDEDDAMSEDDSENDEDKKAESDEDDDDDSDEDEETPVQAKSGKKRSLESATKTPVPDKKAKLVTPQRIDGKKSSVHVDTPHPLKQTGKTPANKPNQQTPKTEGTFSCKSCNRNFKSEVALGSHNKAKHSGK